MSTRKRLRDLDWPLALAAPALLAFGLAALASVTRGDADAATLFHRQVVWCIAGAGAGVLAAAIHYRVLADRAGLIYGATLVLLAGVIVIGRSSGGATRWLGTEGLQVQPGEFAKPAVIVVLSAFWAARGRREGSAATLAWSLAYLAAPMLLVFAQPDLGTALALAAIWAVVAVVAGARMRGLVVVAACAAAMFAIAWRADIIRPYQKQRLLSFLDPSADPLGTGYHVSQSKTAVGSGRLLGWGYGHGPQRRLDFIPAQHTDFVFTVVAEELGFVGALVLIVLYAIIILRCFATADRAADALGRYLAASVGGVIAFQLVINIGMTMGLTPVTGIPLPLVSYGGSSTVATLIMLGLVESVAVRRRRLVF
jgi:rod shape determining protein RodA